MPGEVVGPPCCLALLSLARIDVRKLKREH